MTIAPNPSHDYFQVVMDESLIDAGPLNVTIYSIDGQAVTSSSRVVNDQILSTPDIPGMYLIQMVQPATGRHGMEKLVVR
ncbi:MAG: T9SS type A sorting domain-containing protein [Saprospiraceae bacterium]